MDLNRVFTEWNLKYFRGALPVPELRWNSRLKTTAGRFIPQTRSKAAIEIATYLLSLADAEALVKDTIGHEMIHYWLWLKRKPYGHTAEFYKLMNEMGVSRYNPVPIHRPFKHCYICDECGQKIMVRKRLPKAACAECCNRYSEGKYHSDYTLRLASEYEIISVITPDQVG